jgi:anti-sigma factor RsiW
MLDPVTEELISAYVDGEVSADERAQIEQALADSAECRQRYEELQGLRSHLRSLPHFTLPDDFHQRVIRRAERSMLLAETKPTADAPPARAVASVASSPGASRRALRTWQTVAVSAAAVAAALLFALVMVSRRHRLDIPVGPSGPEQIVENDQDGGAPDGVRSGEQWVADARGGISLRPAYVLVVDLTITPKGRKNRTFEDALKKAGVKFDPSLTVDEDLEDALLRSRYLEHVERVTEPDEEQAADDEVSMVYVTGSGLALDAAIEDLRRKRPRDEIVRAFLDLAIKPQERAVFEGLDDAMRLAGAEPSVAPRARRLVFGFSLRSVPGFLGAIPTPQLTAELLTEDALQAGKPEPSAPAEEGRESKFEQPQSYSGQQKAPQAQQEPAPKKEPVDQIYEVLFILRNLKETPEE